jgi:hypothetical protein
MSIKHNFLILFRKMATCFGLKDHHYRNSKNKVQCRTNSACYVGSITTYQVDIYKIIGLVITWPVIVSKSCAKVKDYFKCLNEMTFSKRQLPEYK